MGIFSRKKKDARTPEERARDDGIKDGNEFADMVGMTEKGRKQTRKRLGEWDEKQKLEEIRDRAKKETVEKRSNKHKAEWDKDLEALGVIDSDMSEGTKKIMRHLLKGVGDS